MFWRGNVQNDFINIVHCCIVRDQTNSCLLNQHLFSCTVPITVKTNTWPGRQNQSEHISESTSCQTTSLFPSRTSRFNTVWIYVLYFVYTHKFIFIFCIYYSILLCGFLEVMRMKVSRFLPSNPWFAGGLFHTLKLNNAATAWRTLMEHARRFLGVVGMHTWRKRNILEHIYYAWIHETALHFFTLPRGPFPYITCIQTLPSITLPYIHAWKQTDRET